MGIVNVFYVHLFLCSKIFDLSFQGGRLEIFFLVTSFGSYRHNSLFSARQLCPEGHTRPTVAALCLLGNIKDILNGTSVGAHRGISLGMATQSSYVGISHSFLPPHQSPFAEWAAQLNFLTWPQASRSDPYRKRSAKELFKKNITHCHVSSTLRSHICVSRLQNLNMTPAEAVEIFTLHYTPGL